MTVAARSGEAVLRGGFIVPAVHLDQVDVEDLASETGVRMDGGFHLPESADAS
jgi:hypothetical protein